MPEEKRLIAELVDRDNERIAAQSALPTRNTASQ